MENKVIVVDYTTASHKIEVSHLASPKKDRFMSLILDINSLEEHQQEFNNIATDSLYPLGGDALEFIVDMNGRRDTQIQDYKIAIGKVEAVINSCSSYENKAFVLIAHFQSEKDEISGRGRMVPNVWGKDLPSLIPKKFSETFQTVVQDNGKGGMEYLWLTRPEGLVGFLGSRIKDNLPRLIEPDFGKLWGDLVQDTERWKELVKEALKANKIPPPRPGTALIVGESHTGKTRSIGTLPGITVLFNLEPKGYQSLRVPYEITSSLRKYWEEKKNEK